MGRTGIYACGESVSRHNSSELVVLFSLKQEASASIGGGTFTITLQSEVMQCVPIHANAVAMSMYSGIFNLGIGSGTWFGGYVITHYTIGDIGYAGGGIAVIAVIYCLFQVIIKVKRREHIHTT